MERTFGWIRPVGMPFRHTIRRRIENAGLNIIKSKILRMPQKEYEELYPREDELDTPEDQVWQYRRFILTASEGEILLIEGEGAIRRLVELVGQYADPAKCAVGTIRRDFGVSNAENFNGYLYHMRVMHRSKNAEEAARNIETAEKLLGIRT